MRNKGLFLRFTASLGFFYVVCFTDVVAHSTTNSTPSAVLQSPFCFKSYNSDERDSENYSKVIDLYLNSLKGVLHPDSVWDQGYLKKHPHVLVAIKDFEKGKLGMALKKVTLKGKTSSQLHKELISFEFHWSEVPLRASLKKRTYWLLDGRTTQDINHPRVVKMIVYVHKDGSLVRMKPRGIPDLRGRHPRRSAQAVKVVLQNIDPRLCKGSVCAYDVSYQNEAFKVSEQNRPLPKAPSPKYGLKLPYEGQQKYMKKMNRLVKNVVMDLAHTNLKTDCPTLH